MCDSDTLREIFYSDKDRIADGWTILEDEDFGAAYETDLVMILRGPDGLLYENEASCCSCNGIDDQWNPVETNLDALKAAASVKDGGEKAEFYAMALRNLGGEFP